MTLDRLTPIEMVAVVDKTDEADEYSLDECTFPPTSARNCIKTSVIVRTNL